MTFNPFKGSPLPLVVSPVLRTSISVAQSKGTLNTFPYAGFGEFPDPETVLGLGSVGPVLQHVPLPYKQQGLLRPVSPEFSESIIAALLTPQQVRIPPMQHLGDPIPIGAVPLVVLLLASVLPPEGGAAIFSLQGHVPLVQQ